MIKTEKTYVGLLIASVMVCMLYGCAGMQGANTAVSAPATEDAYTTLPFKKIINPAFAKEVGGKWVRMEARFYGVDNVVADLPPEYHTGWVRLILVDTGDYAALSRDVVISKDDSDIVFNLKTGDKVVVFAYLVPVSNTYAITGRQEDKILIRIKALRQLSTEIPSDAYISTKDNSYFLQLKPDGTFFSHEISGDFNATYTIAGDTLTITQPSGRVVRAKISSDKNTVYTDNETFERVHK